MPLEEWDKKNFETIKQAFLDGNAALLDVRRRSDGKKVAAIVAVGKDGDERTMTPFAIMVEGNPFELFDPPNPDGGYYEEGP